MADFYAPIRSGTDIAFLSGVMLYLLTNEKYNHREYTEAYTNASLIVRVRALLPARARNCGDTIKPVGTELDENGFAKRDTTLQHRAVSGIC